MAFGNIWEVSECSMPSKSCTIDFPKLTFTASGKYSYTVKELTPSGGGWKTDGRVYRIVVNVDEDENGELVAKVEYPDGFPSFVNKYSKPPPCNICKHFDCLPFPMFWFSPPQKPEFMEQMEKHPHIFDDVWWTELLRYKSDV
jgi:pilin isopeptide linkage protein